MQLWCDPVGDLHGRGPNPWPNESCQVRHERSSLLVFASFAWHRNSVMVTDQNITFGTGVNKRFVKHNYIKVVLAGNVLLETCLIDKQVLLTIGNF